MTEAEIAGAGGLDAYLARGRKTAPPGKDPTPGGSQLGYQWAIGGWSGSNAATNTGGTSTMTIAQPTIQTTVNDHALEQVWVVGGGGASTQTVEVGWTVADDINFDVAPHIFIYSTAADYTEAAACYNGFSYYSCPNWIPSNNGVYPSMTLASYVSTEGGTPQHELTVDVEHHIDAIGSGTIRIFVADGWEVFVGIDGGPLVELGYYPFTDYDGGALSNGAADSFQMGAEIFDWTDDFNQYIPNVEMGEGALGYTDGIFINPPTGHAAYQRNFAYYSSTYLTGMSSTPVSTGAQTPVNLVGQNGSPTQCTTNCTYVAFPSSGNPAESSSWTNWFYFADATKPRFIVHGG